MSITSAADEHTEISRVRRLSEEEFEFLLRWRLGRSTGRFLISDRGDSQIRLTGLDGPSPQRRRRAQFKIQNSEFKICVPRSGSAGGLKVFLLRSAPGR